MALINFVHGTSLPADAASNFDTLYFIYDSITTPAKGALYKGNVLIADNTAGTGLPAGLQSQIDAIIDTELPKYMSKAGGTFTGEVILKANPTQNLGAATKQYVDNKVSNAVDDLNIENYAPLASPTFTGTPKAPTATAGTNNTQIATTAFVNNAIADGLAASDAMVFKGTLGTNGNVTTLPTKYSTGDTYRVITAGTYAGQVCEIGDLIIALEDRNGSGNLNSDWTVAQTNINGAITSISGDDTYIEVSGTGSSKTVSHKASGVTATSYGPSSNATPGHGQKFNVPYITVNAAGHITAATTKEITLPETPVLSGSLASAADTKVMSGFSIDTTDKHKIVGAQKQLNAGDGISITGTASAITITSKIAGTNQLGGIKAGGDITISSAGVVTVDDDSHNHIISNVDGLSDALDGKQATITGGASTITSTNLTTNRVLISNNSGKVAVSAVTSTDLSNLLDALTWKTTT